MINSGIDPQTKTFTEPPDQINYESTGAVWPLGATPPAGTTANDAYDHF